MDGWVNSILEETLHTIVAPFLQLGNDILFHGIALSGNTDDSADIGILVLGGIRFLRSGEL